MGLIKEVSQGNGRAIEIIAMLGYFHNRKEMLRHCLEHGITGDTLVELYNKYDRSIIDMGLDIQKEMREELGKMI